jgi:hypothetical protein
MVRHTTVVCIQHCSNHLSSLIYIFQGVAMSLLDSNEVVGADSFLPGSEVAKSTTLFRTFCAAAAMIVAGCATQHNNPQPPPPTAAASAPSVSPSGAAAPSADERVAAAARKLNLEVVKKDGQVVFCRSNVVTGSRFQKDRQCFTAEQVEAMQPQAQQSGS